VLAWIRRLGRKIRRHLPAIHTTLDHELSNGLAQSVNTKIRVLTRMAFGFRNSAGLIALGVRSAPPGR
jgi:transposase